MSPRYALESAFDLERGQPQEELRCSKQQRFYQHAAPPTRGTLPRTSRHRSLPPSRVRLCWRRHLLRLGKLELPRRRLLLLHCPRHHRLRRFRSHQLSNLQAEYRKLQERVHPNGRVLCLPCFWTHSHSNVLQSTPRRSCGQVFSISQQFGPVASMTVREERL